jgi:hypothetical protein
MKRDSQEFENFDRTMRDLMSVPHSEIKAALDAEKAAKRPRQKGNRDDRRDKDHNSGK